MEQCKFISLKILPQKNTCESMFCNSGIKLFKALSNWTIHSTAQTLKDTHKSKFKIILR